MLLFGSVVGAVRSPNLTSTRLRGAVLVRSTTNWKETISLRAAWSEMCRCALSQTRLDSRKSPRNPSGKIKEFVSKALPVAGSILKESARAQTRKDSAGRWAWEARGARVISVARARKLALFGGIAIIAGRILWSCKLLQGSVAKSR